jgi:hypothetical protein
MQPIRFCTSAKCYEVAIKTARSADKCRTHYRTEVLAAAADELVQCQVVPSEGRKGEKAGVSDCLTNATVHSGLVTLDPAETNIAQLVYSGLVKVVPSAAAEAVKAEA